MSVWLLSATLLAGQPPLLFSRPVAPPPPVAATGLESRVDERTERVPLTSAFALADLDLWDLDARTVFPVSTPAFPADSLVAARAGRAGAWLGEGALGSDGVLSDPVLRAEVEAAAGDDAGAERVFDSALVRAAPSRRSYVLASAIATFVDGERDDSALDRRVAIAERDLGRLLALPRAGYPTAYDSLSVVDRTYQSALAVLAAACRLGSVPRVTARAKDALTALVRHADDERVDRFASYFPFETVAAVLLSQGDGQARLDSLQARVLAAVALGSTGERARALRAGASHRMEAAAFLGHAAQPIAAHAWLNTPDSLYQVTPRARALDDGTIRVLFYPSSNWVEESSPVFPALSRLHQRIAPWGQVVLVMNTEGHVGTELVEPADEVARQASLIREQAQITAVVALWAGAKEPAPDDGRLPAPSPNAFLPPRLARNLPAIVVDGHGIVRGVFPLRSHRDELSLACVLDYLHTESTGSHVAAPRPAGIVASGVRGR